MCRGFHCSRRVAAVVVAGLRSRYWPPTREVLSRPWMSAVVVAEAAWIVAIAESMTTAVVTSAVAALMFVAVVSFAVVASVAVIAVIVAKAMFSCNEKFGFLDERIIIIKWSIFGTTKQALKTRI